MKKLALVSLALLPLAACNEQKVTTPTAEDFAVVDAIVKAATPDMVVATGEMGDTLVRVAQSDELVAITGKDATTTFASVDTAAALAEGTCLINVVTAENYRLFCGTELPADGAAYAVELVAQPAEVVAEPAAEEPAADVAEEAPAEPAAE